MWKDAPQAFAAGSGIRGRYRVVVFCCRAPVVSFVSFVPVVPFVDVPDLPNTPTDLMYLSAGCP